MAKPGFKPDNLSTELELLMTHSTIKHPPKKPTHLSKATSPGSLPSSNPSLKPILPSKHHFISSVATPLSTYLIQL